METITPEEFTQVVKDYAFHLNLSILEKNKEYPDELQSEWRSIYNNGLLMKSAYSVDDQIDDLIDIICSQSEGMAVKMYSDAFNFRFEGKLV